MPPSAHLTRIQLNPTSHHTAHDLRDAHALHRTVLSLAPHNLGDTPRQAAGILFRLEQHPRGHTLLIQSRHPLHLNALPHGYATTTDERDLTPLLAWLQTGATLRYRIDAQPTRCTRPANPGRDNKGSLNRGRLTPLYDTDATTWWHERAQASGLNPHHDTTRTTAQPDIAGWKKNPTGKRIRIRGNVTRFEGTATITDPTTLTTALTTGIGRGRAFGTGLLSIAPHPA
ncbi:type I-E CRISPR-associated protein Cas6/Cse3/CasE [Streptomyces sp. NPDC087440]|uniref:type I-E CRISPR-associated protein Cas6/Cse3/CasE n=1 Tax=Streptomyces sp. NPDC087440 TaxID=3365790 RepID=UPI00380324C1